MFCVCVCEYLYYRIIKLCLLFYQRIIFYILLFPVVFFHSFLKHLLFIFIMYVFLCFAFLVFFPFPVIVLKTTNIYFKKNLLSSV